MEPADRETVFSSGASRHTICLPAQSGQSISEHISHKQVLVGALLGAERQKRLFECVMWSMLSPGQGVGCEIVGIPGYCRLGPPNPLHSLLWPSSPCELCVKGGLPAILASAPPPLSKSSLLSLTFTFAFSPLSLGISPPSRTLLSLVCHSSWSFFSFPVLPTGASLLISGPKRTLSPRVCIRPLPNGVR